MTGPRVTSRCARSVLPATAVFEMTYACNHRCLYCSCPWEAPESRYFRGPEMSTAEWCRLIDHLTTDHEVCRIAFTGGEPTLRADLAEILRYARSRTARWIDDQPERGLIEAARPVDVTVISNGRNLDETVLDALVAAGAALSISLPGLATYAEHTGAGKPEEALHWMRRAADRGVRVTANITVTALNIGELYETIGNALAYGASFVLMNRFLPGGRGLAWRDRLWLTGAQVREAVRVADDVLTKAGIPGSLGTEVPLCLVADLPTRRLTVGTRCAAAHDFFAVDPSGRIRPCNHSPVALGHWTDLAAIVRSDYWGRFLFKRFLPDSCRGCNLAGDCDGGCREAAHICGGALDSPDPVLPGGKRYCSPSAS